MELAPQREPAEALELALRRCCDLKYVDRVLFDLGARAGRLLAALAPTDASLRERIERAFVAAHSAGYGSLQLIDLDADLPAGHCHLHGEIADDLESTDNAVILIDNDDVVRYWNRGAERMFQLTPGEVVGRRIGRIVPADLMVPGELDEMRARLDRGESVTQLLTRRVRKGGVERWRHVTHTPLHDAQGRVVGSTAILRDVADQRRTETELAGSRAVAAVGEMAAKLAHGVKNPLAGIYAAVQVLARDLEREDTRRAIFDEIGAEVRRVEQTVIDLLRFYRPVPPRLRPTSLAALARDTVELLRGAHPSVELALELPEDLILLIDERMIGTALENLVSNALQAVDGRGTRVVVAARREPGGVAIEVRDDGPGIAPAQREEVLEPFFTTKTRGTGLGLPIALKNAQAHGGSLELDDAPEGGARFTLRLPEP